MPGQKFGPAWFPGVIAAGLGLCGVGLVFSGLRERGKWLAFADWIQRARPRAAVAAVIAGLLFYVFAADALGFYLTALLILLVWMRVLGASWRLALPVAAIATIVIHLSFYKALRIPLPWGVLEPFAF
jgi:putative tricarboxylic transport membrane protein